MVTEGVEREREYQVVSTAVYNALARAEAHNYKSSTPDNLKIDSVVFPTLGFGFNGSLTPEQSARAMMGGIAHYLAEGGKTVKIIEIVVYRDTATEEVSRMFAWVRDQMFPKMVQLRNCKFYLTSNLIQK